VIWNFCGRFLRRLHAAGARSRRADGGDTWSAVISSPLSSTSARPALAGDDALRTPHFIRRSPPACAVFFQQHAEDDAHALERPGEALEEERLEHDHELPELHVVLLRAAVVHQRAEQHVLEQRIGDVRPTTSRADTGGRRARRRRRPARRTSRGSRRSAREISPPPRLQHGEIVGEPQRRSAARPKAMRDCFCSQSANSSRSMRSWRSSLPSGVPFTPGARSWSSRAGRRRICGRRCCRSC
jgi:hypothetical protein